jgi:hypothetical protein
MKPFIDSPWKQRGVYFVAGAAVAFLCGYVQLRWMAIVPYGAFDRQPDWLKRVKELVGWLPWVIVAVVLVLRLIQGARIRAGAYLLGTLAVPVVLIGWLVFGDTVAEWMHRRSFDAEAWRTQQSTEHDPLWPPRLCMVDNLMNSERLLGMNRDEVVELLGPPEPIGFPAGAASCDMHYYLGPERGFFRIDSEWLFLKFGDDGRVSHQWLYRD